VTDYPAVEPAMREPLLAGDFDGAATAVVRTYGAEIAGFLIAFVGNPGDAADVFSMFCEDLWRGLPAFEGTASLRTWAYTLARHAAIRYVKDPRHRAAYRMPLSGAPELEAAARTATQTFQQTAVKDRFAEVRARLDPDDRALLVLRVDRGLPWRDVARVLGGSRVPDRDLDRQAAALRKRFERLKDELRALLEN
jgi:RNA polymerase sigma-70 factor (ECF subfamily)